MKLDDDIESLNKPPSSQENSLEFFSFLNRAFGSIYALNQLTYLNRTTRLVHENESGFNDNGASTASLLPSSTTNSESISSFEGEREGVQDESSSLLPETSKQDGSSRAGKLQQGSSTRDDIMLLCKLLHKQLENGSIIQTNGSFFSQNGSNLLSQTNPVGSTNNSQKQQRTSTSTTVRPRDLLRDFLSSGLHVSEPQNDLNDTHESHLLESVFSLEKRAAREASYEESAQRLLADLFNAGFRRKFARQLNSSASPAEPFSSGDHSNAPTRSEQRLAPIQLKSWSRTITGGKGGRLRLVYWLVMPAGEPIPPAQFKTLDLDEAHELLDELDHAFIQQSIDDALLIRPLVLVAPFKRTVRSNESSPNSPGPANDELLPAAPSPNVLDDQLNPANETNSKPDSKSSSGLKDFIERLFTGSLEENLQIYLIALIILLFLIVMCFAIPLICCKSCPLFGRRSESSAALTTAATTTATAETGSSSTSAGRFTSRLAQSDNNQANFGAAQQRPVGRRSKARNGNGGGQRNGSGGKQQARKHTEFESEASGKRPVSSISSALKLPTHVGRKRSETEVLEEYDEEYDLSRTSGTINEAVWTKLSDSTTTLTKDRTRLMYDDGRVDIPIVRQRQANGGQLVESEAHDEGRLKRFEWYTFEDKTTTTSEQFGPADGGLKRDKQSQTLTDHMKMTRSVQTSNDLGDSIGVDGAMGGQLDQQAGLLNMSFSERMETRNSDTLTKSELVLLKEKLIPIGRQQLARSPPDSTAAPTSGSTSTSARERPQDELADLACARATHDYVNQPTRHIDSSIDDSTNGMSKSLARPIRVDTLPAGSSVAGDERTPKMRFLELPSKAQSRMEAIKGELAKLEARQESPAGRNVMPGRVESRPATSTYKRYDVI